MTDSGPKLPSGRPRPQKQGNLGTVIALFSILLIGGLLVGLTAIVMPNVLGIVVLVFAAAFFFSLHYVTWGRWLMNRRRNLEDDA